MRTYIVSAILLIVIDGIYLYHIKNYFKRQIEDIQHTPLNINILSTIGVYVLLVIGLNYFIIQPNKGVQDAFLLGIVIYGVYEFTNSALFTKWKFLTVVMDTFWGGCLLAITTWLMKKIFIKHN
jgi:uncharacterized membrane protein